MKKSALFTLGLFLIFLSVSCRKKNKDDCPLCPKIDALSPASGKKGDTIVITGSNFSNSLTENLVKFNGTLVPPSDMISGNSTQLKVRVPAKCGTGPVTVTLDQELYSDDGPVFTYHASAVVTVFAGSSSGASGNTNGGSLFKNILMNKPSHVAMDASNNIYVLDNGNLKVRKLNVSTGMDEVLTDNTTLENPCALAVDENNILYISSYSNAAKKSSVYRLTPGSTFPDHYFTDPDAVKRHVSLNPEGNGQFFIGRVNADYAALVPQIRHYSTTNGVEAFADSVGNVTAYKNGFVYQIRSLTVGSVGTMFSKFSAKDKTQTVLLKTTFGLNGSQGLALDDNGNAYICDTNNNRLLLYSSNGTVTTLVSIGLNRPQGIVLDKQGTIYIADSNNHCIKKIVFE
jgi:hypothetical protein